MKTINGEERYRKIFELSPEAIAILNRKGRVLDINGKVYELLGYKTEEIIGKTLLQLPFFSKKSRIVVSENFLKRMLGKNINPYDVDFIGKGGKKIVGRIRATHVRDKNRKIVGLIIMVSDVTKFKEIEKAKTEFVSLASHQLRTPLTAINWSTEILLTKDFGKLTHKQEEILKKIYSHGRRMVRLVNALLNTSRIELGTLAVEPKPVSLVKIADSVMDEFSLQIKKKKIGIKKEYQKGLPIIDADPQLVRIIFQNLISNSINYTPDKGIIDLRIEEKKKNILITIADTGYGIPKIQQSKIFTKLFRADNIRTVNPDGAGLGLYIVRSVLEQSGGKIWFESSENKGTTFYVTIPLSGMEKKEGAKGLI